MLKELPLLPQQAHFFSKIRNEDEVLMMVRLLDVGNNVDVDKLKQAIDLVIKNHQSFYLVFRKQENSWKQYLQKSIPDINLDILDYSSLQNDLLQQKLKSTIEYKRALFNLQTGKLIYTCLIKTLDSNILLICAHHLCMDGKSWLIFFKDLEYYYKNLILNSDLLMKKEDISYESYLNFIGQNTNHDHFKMMEQYWLSKSADGHNLIPFDTNENRVCSDNKISEHILTLGFKEVINKLSSLSNNNNDYLQAFLLTVLAATLYPWIGAGGVLVDCRSRGRRCFKDYLNLANTIGWCSVTYPIRLALKSRLTKDDVQDYYDEIILSENNSYGHCLLKKDNQAQISFNYHGNFDNYFTDESLFKLIKGPDVIYINKQARRNHLLDLNIYLLNKSLYIHWRYDEQYHSPATIKNLAFSYQANIKELISFIYNTPQFSDH